MSNQINLSIESEARANDINSLSTMLDSHNMHYGEEYQKLPLAVFARDENGKIVGGLSGFTVWSWFTISLLAVDKESRTQGLGRQLLALAEKEARHRGCTYAVLDTFSFQARPFYEKFGYEVFGELADFPPGHSRFYMRKAL